MRQYRPSTPSTPAPSQSSFFSSSHDVHPQPDALYLGGKLVPPGAFVMYPFSDVHLSSQIYKDPWRWDPGRAEMALKAPYSYVGMGAGACRFCATASFWNLVGPLPASSPGLCPAPGPMGNWGGPRWSAGRLPGLLPWSSWRVLDRDQFPPQ